MTSDFFEGNRIAIGEKLEGGIVVVAAYSRTQRSNDMAAHFQQEANFWYLTGIDEPDCVVIIDGSQRKSWLVLPDVDEVHRTFDGSISIEEARRISGVKDIISADEAMALLRTLARKHGLCYSVGPSPYSEHFNFVLNPAPAKQTQVLERTFKKVQDCRMELAQLRAIKQSVEIAATKRAIALTAKTFTDVKMKLSTYKREYEIEAEFSHAFRYSGASGHAYDPIIATGKNACTLHYGKNSASIGKRDLVLMDVGASVDGYAADITRTYVVTKPTKRQAAVHAAVNAAHHRIIETIEPLLPLDEYQRRVDSIMMEALHELGLKNDVESLRRHMPHAVSHGLGIDVHDSLGAPKRFETGMVLTVEPGIYLPEESIGVRIEDDILVTANGRQNLSRSLSTEL